MKKTLVVSLATAALLTFGQTDGAMKAHAQTPVVQAGQTAKVTATSLNVRSMPSVNGSILGKLPQNATITITQVTNGWAQVSYNGKTAYVNAQYLQPSAQTAASKGVVTASALNVRNMPSSSGAVIGTLSKGTTVTIAKKFSNGWLEISYKGKSAYVYGGYIAPAGSTPTTTSPTTPTQPTNPPAATTTGQLSAYELKVVELTNAERTKAGLPTLQIDMNLSKVARMKSEDMLKNNYFSHTSPTYGSPFDMMRSNGITYRSAGENIAMGQRTPEEVVNAWMNSPGHRANILNNSFTHIGVGYIADKNIWTQQFIGN
ncbi:SH3 domain-containing protein [Ectobacillus panaciterrae]|uniref:SH3 domain-containing protein n=1 Tax=Ectobacillus panaciterrae TaxID=363872 RepID=UPI0003FD2E52|nr:SH3 domain-containing protein [Ectobacillus panaciterrae]